MDLKTLRSEMRRMSEMIDGWNSPNQIPQIERDLVLSKLRGLYDMVRFSEPTIEQEPDHVSSTGVDLGDVLSLGLVAELDAADAEVESVAESVIESVAESDIQIDNNPELSIDDISESEVIEEDIFVVEPESEVLVVNISEIEVAADDILSIELQTEAVEDISEIEVVIEEIPEVKSNSQPMLASLFGSDEPVPTRHRQRQRMIMSLYDDEPQMPNAPQAPKLEVNHPTAQRAAAPSITSEDDSDDVFEELSLDMIVTSDSSLTRRGVADGEAAPDDESFGGDVLPEYPSPSTLENDDPSPEAPQMRLRATDSSTQGRLIGEVINDKVQILADSFASPSERLTDLAHRAPIGKLRSVLGLNDRYLLMHDLFNNDAQACDSALAQLDDFDNLDDCMIYIAENYSWNPDCAGAKFLMELLERKFS